MSSKLQLEQGSHGETESAEMNFSGRSVMDRPHMSTMYRESRSLIPGIPADAPLTVKQHFQQQRKQQKNRARREAKRLLDMTPTSAAAPLQACVAPKMENTTKTMTNSAKQDSHPARALSEPAFCHQSQPPQMRPSTSRSADQEILRNTNMKVDPRLFGSFGSEDYGSIYGETTTTLTMRTSPANTRRFSTKPPVDVERSTLVPSQLDSSAESYGSVFHSTESGQSERKTSDVLRNEELSSYCSTYQTNRYNDMDQTLGMHMNESSKLGYCLPADFANMYSSEDGFDVNSAHCDPGMCSVNVALEQNHTDSDSASFDQGVEKLDTETDERFLSWLYCENEHAEDDNAEYTRVLEEIEKDECYPHKMEGDTHTMDFGAPTCMPSTTHADMAGKMQLDPSHPLASDCVVGEYASLPPTVPPRDPVPEGYSVNDFESDLDLDMIPTGEDEETLYGRLLDVLVRDIKLLTYNNAALVDEVSRLNYAILIASEERKVLARRSCHHDRNRIRRLQTANKRKSDAQKRQQEQLTIAETQENIAQIKAKMAKTINSPQKTKTTTSSAAARPELDVAAIKRSVEEQRALEETIPPKRSKRKAGSLKLQRKRLDSACPEKEATSSQISAAVKRGRSEAERAGGAEEVDASSENCSVPPAEAAPSRRSAQTSETTSETVAEHNQRRRANRQLIREGFDEGHEEAAGLATNSGEHDESAIGEASSHSHDDEALGGELEQNAAGEKDDESQSWRRRSGRPPARAASAAAQTLLAAELATSEEVPTYSPRRAIRSRSNTSDPLSSRPTKRRVTVSQSEQPQSEEHTYSTGELTVDIYEDLLTSHDSTIECHLELDTGDEMTPASDLAEHEDTSKATQRLRPVRRITRTSSHQSAGDTADGSETSRHYSTSPCHREIDEKSEPMTRATRSHGRPNATSTPQLERQTRERKQPSMYSPVGKNASSVQPRVVKRKS